MAPLAPDHERLGSAGQPLDANLRSFMEPRFGYDFSRVRVHADGKAGESARELGARGYTIGHDIVFAPSDYPPRGTLGMRLLAHELTHVIQQRGQAGAPHTVDVSAPADASEREAADVEHSFGEAAGQDIFSVREKAHLQAARQKHLERPSVDKFFDDEEDFLAAGPLGNPYAGHPWPDLPRAARDAKHQITIKKGTPPKTTFAKGKKEVTPAVQNTADVPDITKPTLDKQQQDTVDQIRKKRDALPDLLTGTSAAGAVGKGGVGYMYPGKNPGQPTSVKAGGTDDKSKREKWIWEEVGGEGGSSSINTYDAMDVTYGKGFAPTTLPGVLNALFAKDPEAKAMLMDVGLTLDGPTWLMVNTDLGAVEEGTNALRLLEVNPKLLSLLITIGEDPKHAQINLDVQWAKVMAGSGKYPAYASTWSEAAFKIGFHLAHWLPGYGWGAVDYATTGGDTLKIVKTFAKASAGAAKPNGAHIVPAMWGLLSHLKTFGGGAGLTALRAAAGGPVTIPAGNAGTDPAWSGKLLVPDGKDTYLTLPL